MRADKVFSHAFEHDVSFLLPLVIGKTNYEYEKVDDTTNLGRGVGLSQKFVWASPF